MERNGHLLLVASRYPNHPEPLWNLPGGRQRPGELLRDALRREFLEEAGLAIDVGELRYLSESYDLATGTHFTSVAFGVTGYGEPSVSGSDAHVVEAAWVAHEQLAARLTVRVVREPLLAHLADPQRRYFAFSDAGITIRFNDDA